MDDGRVINTHLRNRRIDRDLRDQRLAAEAAAQRSRFEVRRVLAGTATADARQEEG